jgi:hypothetical protein
MWDGQGLKGPLFGASFRITKAMSVLPMFVSYKAHRGRKNPLTTAIFLIFLFLPPCCSTGHIRSGFLNFLNEKSLEKKILICIKKT